MGYIIVAEVDTTSADNHHAKIETVDARILSNHDGKISFDIRGDFDNRKQLTKDLCITLIDSGFLEFSIHHSY